MSVPAKIDTAATGIDDTVDASKYARPEYKPSACSETHTTFSAKNVGMLASEM